MKYILILTLSVLFSCASIKSPPRDSSQALEPDACMNSAENENYKLTHASPPGYPMAAAHKKQEGWVLTQYNVNPDGSVTNVKVVDSSPEGMFDLSAIRTASRFRYAPIVNSPEPTIRCFLLQYKIGE